MTEANKTYLGFSVQNDTKAGLQEIKNDVRSVAETAVQAGQRAASAFDGMGRSGEEAAVKLTRSESAIAAALRRSIEQMELAQRQAAGMADAFDFKIGFRGIDTSKLQPAIDHLRQLEAQISVTKAAEAEFAAQNAFAQKHAQAAALAKSAEYTSWWATELDKAKAAEAELAAQNAFAIKHQQATELAKASQYASWWAAELDKVEAAERKLASETAFLSSLKAQTDAIGKTRADLLEMQAAQMGVSSQAAPFIAKLRETEQGLGKMGQSAGQTRMALQQLPLQFQDIVVSLQAGQQPFTVFLQQGSQIAGSFGGANAALKAMANYVWSLVNPYTVAAAAVVALGVAMAQAESSLRTHQTLMNQLEATGRAGYLNSDAVKQLKADMAELPGISKSMATAIIADLVQVRTLGGEALEKIALLSADFAAATGQDAAGAAKELAKAMEDPAKGARALDDAFNFLTSSQLLMVDAMVEAGDKAGAQELVLEALQKRLEGVAKQGLTPLQDATNEFAKAWAEAMKDLGHGGPLQVANELMAGLVIHTADAVRWLAQLKPPAWLEEAAKGGLNGWVYRVITGDAKLPKQSSGGASGSWGPNTGGASGSWGAPSTPELSDLEKEVKLALEAAKSYEAKGASVEKVRGDIARFNSTLQKLRDDGKGDGPAAKELEKRIEGAQEKLKSLTKTTQSHSKELEC